MIVVICGRWKCWCELYIGEVIYCVCISLSWMVSLLGVGVK